jgi:hypothetical protein
VEDDWFAEAGAMGANRERIAWRSPRLVWVAVLAQISI